MLANIKKAIASAVGVALTVATLLHSLPFLHGPVGTWTGVVIAILTPIATYLVPNKPVGTTNPGAAA